MFLKNFNVKNKTALVTGSGKGIGKACAIALAEAGANVIILSRTEKDLLIVQNKIKKLKRTCIINSFKIHIHLASYYRSVSSIIRTSTYVI